MEFHPANILAMVDCIAESTTDDDLQSAVESIRRLKLSGIKPSLALKELVIAPPPSEDSLHARVSQLTQQVDDLTEENTQLEAQVIELTSQLRHSDEKTIIAINGFYTMEQFLLVLFIKLRRSYGWRTDYIRASQETEGCRPVANENIQTWKNRDQVPDWAVEQIDRLTFQKRHGAGGEAWSDDNEKYLIEQYLRDPWQSNVALALLCETEFSRTVNDNAIKGALDRLRKRGLLPTKRPAKRNSSNR